MAKKGAESCFVDTNILVYASDKKSPWHKKANDEIKKAIRAGGSLFISPQVLRECLSVATCSVTRNKTIPWEKISKNHLRFQQVFKVLPEDAATTNKLEEYDMRLYKNREELKDTILSEVVNI